MYIIYIHISHIFLYCIIHRAFLELDEFPPDANRGFDMPSPRVTYTATAAAAAGKRGGGAAERERIGSSAQLEECTSIQVELKASYTRSLRPQTLVAEGLIH